MKRLLQNDVHLFDEVHRIERMDVLEGPTGRRAWPDHEKVRIVLESFEPGARVCEVARRNGLIPQHLSTWRSLARKGKLPMPVPADEPCFAALEIISETQAAPKPAGTIEIEVDGVSVRLASDAPAARVAELVAALKAP